MRVGASDGAIDGVNDGAMVGAVLGEYDGGSVGAEVGVEDGDEVGAVGSGVGAVDTAECIGLMIKQIQNVPIRFLERLVIT